MRKWHRWLSVLFGVFLVWIAVTGVLSQVGTLVNRGGFERPEQAPQAGSQQAALPPGVPADFKCPEVMTCRPKPKPAAWNVGLLHHLHSGESFGPAGTIVSILSGLALVFFSISGLWMYVRMFRARTGRQRATGSKFFWN